MSDNPTFTYVDPTAHRPGDLCDYCDDLNTCPGHLGNRTSQQYRVEEGWDADSWNPLGLPKNHMTEAQLSMQKFKERFPQMPMRVVAETTTYMVVATAPGNAPASDGDEMT